MPKLWCACRGIFRYCRDAGVWPLSQYAGC
nr:MAG TPA: hypothetical protein [Bacteriophage sp.]